MLRPPAAALPFLLLSAMLHTRAVRADITLADAVRLALARNERSRIAELGTISADAAVSRSRAAFLPTISLGGSETLRPYTVEQNGRTTVRSNAASGSLTINQPILSAGAFPLYSAAKHNRESARHDELNQRRQLAFDAARAFFAVVTQQRVGLAARRRLERAEAGLADTRARAEAGLVSSNDVTRSQIERASAVQTVANASGGLAEARVSLEYVLDEPVTGDLQPPDNLLAPSNIDIAQLANQAIARRPDLMSARESALAASASADEPGLRFVPTLGASGQARVADQALAGDRYIDTTLTLNLAWAIWDAGVRSADSESRKAAAETADLEVRALQRRIQADVRSAVAELTAARDSLAAAQEAVDAAGRSSDETNVLYKQGLAKAIELVDANLSRFDSEVNLAAAQLALRQAELDLRAGLGLFPIDGVQ